MALYEFSWSCFDAGEAGDTVASGRFRTRNRHTALERARMLASRACRGLSRADGYAVGDELPVTVWQDTSAGFVGLVGRTAVQLTRRHLAR